MPKNDNSIDSYDFYMLTEKDSVFDGMCHRPYLEELDGWRNRIPKTHNYPSVVAAQDTISLFNDLKAAVYRI